MIYEIFQIILFGVVLIALINKVYKAIKLKRYVKEIERKKNYTPKPKIQTAEEIQKEREELEIVIKLNFEKYYENILGDKDFINKNAKSLEDYIINPDLNEWDLHKLAQLNGIKLELAAGWYPLVIQLMQELKEKGWNKVVGSIKEKYGELRFYADIDEEELLDKYTELSTNICEVCGEEGTLKAANGWFKTLCEKHRQEN